MNLPTTTTRVSRSEQGAASKPCTNRHHSRASRSEQWAAIGKRERGLNYFDLAQISLSFEKLRFLSLLIRTRDNLLPKLGSSSSEDQPFSGCTHWRSDFLSAFYLSSRFLFPSSRSEVLDLPRVRLFNISQKIMGGRLIVISILLGCPNIFQCHALLCGPDWDSNPRFRFIDPRFQPLDHHDLDFNVVSALH